MYQSQPVKRRYLMAEKISCKNCNRRPICQVADNLLAELSYATIKEPGFFISDALEAAAQAHYIMEKIAQAAGDKADRAGFGPEPPPEIMEEVLRLLNMIKSRRPINEPEEVHSETIH
jgi:hypothetical protein